MSLEFQTNFEYPQSIQSIFIEKSIGPIQDQSLKKALENLITQYISDLLSYIKVLTEYTAYLNKYLAVKHGRQKDFSQQDRDKMDLLGEKQVKLSKKFEENKNQIRNLLRDQISPDKVANLVLAMDRHKNNLAKYPQIFQEYKQLTEESSNIRQKENDWFDLQMKKSGMTRAQALSDQNHKDYILDITKKSKQESEKKSELIQLRSFLPDWPDLEKILNE